MVTDLWRVLAKIDTPSSFTPLAFDNCWEDRNVDYCTNTAVYPSMSNKNFVTFGRATLLALPRFLVVCTAGDTQ